MRRRPKTAAKVRSDEDIRQIGTPETNPGYPGKDPRLLTEDQAKKKDWNLSTRYGIDLDDYIEMWLLLDGKCQICRRPARAYNMLMVEHDHECCTPMKKRTAAGARYQDSRACGRCVRGLVCGKCNAYLGKFERLASRERLRDYLGWWNV